MVVAMARRSLCFMLAGTLTAIPTAFYADMVLAGVAGSRWTFAHWLLASAGSVGGLWLWEELSELRNADAPNCPGNGGG
jgi:hypothetical protein